MGYKELQVKGLSREVRLLACSKRHREVTSNCSA